MQVNVPLDFEERCWSCGGDHETPHMVREDGVCAICGGKTTVLTALGEAVIAMLSRHVPSVKGGA